MEMKEGSQRSEVRGHSPDAEPSPRKSSIISSVADCVREKYLGKDRLRPKEYMKIIDNTLIYDPRYHVHMSFVLFSVLLISLYYFPGIEESPLLIIGLVGALGGAANNYRRLAEFDETKFLYDSRLRQLALRGVYSSMMWATVLALIFYIVMQAGLVQGELFPKFGGRHFAAGQVADGPGILDFLWMREPEGYTDRAKAIVWAFIAGYSEKFVPNILDDLDSNSKDKGGAAKK
jgi:hypothetical protein